MATIPTTLGTTGSDKLTGTINAELLSSLAGDDTLKGAGGNDVLVGGEGNDVYLVGATPAGAEVVISDAKGFDTLDASAAKKGVTLDLTPDGSSTVDGSTVKLGGKVALGAQPLDLVLLQDLSGSFSDDISTVRTLTPSLITGVQALNPEVAFGLTSFVDKPIGSFGYSPDYVYKTDVALSTDATKFQAGIDSLTIFGGGDGPEAQLEALLQLARRAAEVGFRPGARHVVVLTTDATYHQAGDGASAGITVPNDGDGELEGTPAGTGEDYPNLEQVRAALASSGIVPVFAVTSDQVATYQNLAAELGVGLVTELKPDSSNLVELIGASLEEISLMTATIEKAVGSDFADKIIGNDLDNVLVGGLGNDSLAGGGGDDTFVFGGVTSTQTDLVVDAAGIDTIDATAAKGAASIDLRPGKTSTVDTGKIILGGESTVKMQPLDLVLLEDLSGSFSDDVSTVSALVPTLTAAVTAVQPDSEFGLASFVDKPISPFGSDSGYWGGSPDYVYKTELPLTTDVAALQAAVNGMVVLSGNDGPESQIEALMQAALRVGELGYRKDALKVVLVMTDAEFHKAGDGTWAYPPITVPNNGDIVLDGTPAGTGEDYPTTDMVRKVLLENGVLPVFAVSDPWGYGAKASYESLVAEWGFGVVTNLQSDSADLVEVIKSALKTVGTSTPFIENARGGAAADTLIGNTLDNLLQGNAGNDSLTGGEGADTLEGGAGNDSFVYDTPREIRGDLITDFQDGRTDSINLSALSGYKFVGNKAFTDANQIRYNVGTTTTTVEVSGLGGTVVETLELTGKHNLVETKTGSLILVGDTVAPPPAATPVVSLGDIVVAEGDSGTSKLTVTVHLSEAAKKAVTLSYKTIADTATAGEDFVALTTKKLTIPAGKTEASFTVTIKGDDVLEDDEDFGILLSSVKYATFEGGESTLTATVTIANDDKPEVVTYELSGTDGNDFLTPTLPGTVEGLGGDDTYLISPYLFPTEGSVEIIDGDGDNWIQFVDSSTISDISVSGSSYEFTFSEGGTLVVQDAENFMFELDGDLAMGIEGEVLDASELLDWFETYVAAEMAGVASAPAIV